MAKLRLKQSIYSFIFICFTIFNCTQKINAQKTNEALKTDLENCIPKLLNTFKVPGLGIALVHNGEVDWVRSFGYANKEKGIKVSNSTVFQAASISKPITALAVMKLVEQGKLDLNAPAERYLTRWHLPDSHFNKDAITISRLLSHTAGLSLHGVPGFLPEQDIPSIEQALSGASSSKIKVEIVEEPGKKVIYSGGGYALLSLIIEEVTGELFEDYIKKEILLPLGMENSSYNWEDYLINKTATAYDNYGKPLPNFKFALKAAASLYTTPEDMAKCIVTLVKKTNCKSEKQNILRDSTVDLLFQPVASLGRFNPMADEMGLGFLIDKLENECILILHGGTNIGWQCIFAMFPNTGDGIAIFTNSINGISVYTKILEQWSQSICNATPKVSSFYNNVFHVLLILAILLYISSLMYIWNFVRRRYYVKRKVFWKISTSKSWEKPIILSGRLIFLVLLPIFVVYFLCTYFYIFFDMMSTLASFWITSGLVIWLFIIVILGLFPKINEKKI